MKTLKHTPSPWHYRPQFIAEGSTVIINGTAVKTDPTEGAREIYDRNGLWVASAHGGNVRVSREACLANARMIAAAPMMFDALAAIGNMDEVMQNPDVRSIVSNALAIALGGSPESRD